ncbi:insect cuticle protein domain-containing protein [Phthorimaea operculella]|nr:insect cuticle protein domain-containing protein [Phthorimaea operculella]
MKLIPLIILLTYLPDIQAQKFRQEQFPFPPQFQSPNAGMFSSDTQKPEPGYDQARAASFQGPQFLPAGGGLYVSSTTEPAIPILRLSNEMDLDGSFSYEALGADQTHYVQHSRMENMGPDKAEQVVEGSYSYVGDNGQTYTVHYIADANGFRASGDHLPVAPPVPEIIQRAVQYNIAEEAKKPPHLRDNGQWQPENENWQQNTLRDNVISDNTKSQQFAPPPTRNLFTGRTPEAFSYSYSQGSNTGNNLATAAKKLAMPQLVNYEAGLKEAEQDPNKGLWRWQYGYNANNLNQNPNKDTISRSFGEGDDIMINFGDMTPEQYTKMIRSQFEYTPENNEAKQQKQNENQNTHVATHFNSNQRRNEEKQYQNFLSQDAEKLVNKQKQYQNHIQNEQAKQQQSHFVTSYNENQRNNEEHQYQSYNQIQQVQPVYQDKRSYDQSSPKENTQQSSSEEKQYQNYNQIQQLQPVYQDNHSYEQPSQKENTQHSPSTVTPSPQSENWYKQSHEVSNEQQSQSTVLPIVESRKLISDTPKILTHKDFIYPSQTITQSYDFDEDTFYEPRKIKALNTEPATKATTNNANNIQENFQRAFEATEGTWNKVESEVKESTTPEPYISSVSNFKFSDFIFQEDKSDFKPIITSTSTEVPRLPETTTENIIEDILENNIFLKNLFNVEKTEMIPTQKSELNTERNTVAPQKVLHIKIEAEPKADKIPKFVSYHGKPANEVKIYKKKPMDFAEIMNYMSMKNHFESNKMKINKNKSVGDFDNRSESRFIPIQHEREETEKLVPEQKPNYRPEHQDELRGIIKNYKVLQRNNNANKYDNSPLKRELSPPPLKSPNLPPLGRAGPSMKSYLPPIFV